MQWKNIFLETDYGWKNITCFFPDRLDSTIYIPIFFARRRTFATVFVYTNVQSRFSLISQKHALSCLFGGRDPLFVLRNGRRKLMIKDRFSFVFSRVILPFLTTTSNVKDLPKIE